MKTINFVRKNLSCFCFILLLFPIVSGWIEMIYFYFIINLSFSLFLSAQKKVRAKECRENSNPIYFFFMVHQNWLLAFCSAFSAAVVATMLGFSCNSSETSAMRKILFIFAVREKWQFSLFERSCYMSTWIKRQPLIWFLLYFVYTRCHHI